MKRLFDYFKGNSKEEKSNSASVAKERLQILIAKDMSDNLISNDIINKIQAEFLLVVKKYINITEENVDIYLQKTGDYEVLELNITLPEERKKNKLN